MILDAEKVRDVSWSFCIVHYMSEILHFHTKLKDNTVSDIWNLFVWYIFFIQRLNLIITYIIYNSRCNVIGTNIKLPTLRRKFSPWQFYNKCTMHQLHISRKFYKVLFTVTTDMILNKIFQFNQWLGKNIYIDVTVFPSAVKSLENFYSSRGSLYTHVLLPLQRLF